MSFTGHSHSKATKLKMKLAKMGWNPSAATRKKMSESKKGRKAPNWGKFGEQSSNWKGENVHYGRLHSWFRANYPPPAACAGCGKKRKLDLAYNDHASSYEGAKYIRDISRFSYLCRGCHAFADGRLQKMWKISRNRKKIKR